MRVVDERPTPGVQNPEHSQGGSQATGIARQILKPLGAGVEEQVVAQLRMRAQPRAERLRDGEGHQEIRHGQQQGPVGLQPMVGVGGAALWTVPVIAGVVTEELVFAVGTAIHGTTERRGAAPEDRRQDFTLAGRHRRSKTREVIRRPAAQDFMNAEAFATVRGGGQAHRNRASEVAHERVQTLLVLCLAERGQMSVDGGGDRTAVTEVDLKLPEVLTLFEEVSGIGMSESVDRSSLLDAAGFEGEAKGTLQGGTAHGFQCGGCAETIVPLGREEEFWMAMGSPKLAKPFQSPVG